MMSRVIPNDEASEAKKAVVVIYEAVS